MDNYINDFDYICEKIIEAINLVTVDNENQEEIKFFLLEEVEEMLKDNKSQILSLKK